MPSLDAECAGLFTVGFHGAAPSPEVRELVRHGAAGVILFARNVESAEQVAALSAALKREAGRPLLVAVKQEGGRVARLRAAGLHRAPAHAGAGRGGRSGPGPAGGGDARERAPRRRDRPGLRAGGGRGHESLEPGHRRPGLLPRPEGGGAARGSPGRGAAVGRHAIRTWLEPTTAIALDGSELVIGAPDQFAVEWNETKHAGVLARLTEPLLGHATRIVFRVEEERQQRPQMDFFVAPPASEPVAAAAVRNTQPLNERYTFDTFVIGKSNDLAAAAAHAVAEAPGKTYNPLFIYGATGLGKTHLMQAIAHAVIERNPETRVLFVGISRPRKETLLAARVPSMGAVFAMVWGGALYRDYSISIKQLSAIYQLVSTACVSTNRIFSKRELHV